jgi:protein-L-isoaspartate(D-aspartate) O-methyltransferase
MITRAFMKKMLTTIAQHSLCYQKEVIDPCIYQAITSIPRSTFGGSNEDHAMSIGCDQTISQPFMVAIMTDLLLRNVVNTRRVMEIGAGSGYQCAILSSLFNHVVGIERIQTLCKRAKASIHACELDNITIHHANGQKGWPERAPYDAILVACGVYGELPFSWIEQLDDHGILIAPHANQPNSSLVIKLWQKQQNKLFLRPTFAKPLYCQFVPFIDSLSAD